MVAANQDAASQTHAQNALEELCRAYWYPLYAFVRNRGYSPTDAEDLTQAFFARLIETRGFASADPERGRFRSYLLGVLSTLERKHVDAANWYSTALRDHQPGQPARFWCHYRHAFSCQKLKRYDEAFIHYGICLGVQPEFAWPKFNMGLACLDVGKPELAESHIRHAIQTDPKFTAAYIALLAILIQQEDYAQAIAIYEQATALGLSSSELTNNYNIAIATLKPSPAAN